MRRPISKIICATDLSESADEAMRQAAHLATLYQASLVVFHAVPEPVASAPLFPHLGLVERSGFVALERRVLEALHRRVNEVLPSTPVELLLSTGDAHAAILEHTERVGADLIVVGGEGAKGGARVLLGAVAERVVRHAHVPVWVSRKTIQTGPVLIGTDFSEPASRAVEMGADYAQRVKTSVKLVHALSISRLRPTQGPSLDDAAFPTWSTQEVQALRDAAQERVNAALKTTAVDGTVAVVDESPGRALPNLAAAEGCRMICVGTAGHTGLTRVLLGSVAEEIVRKANCPVLVTRTP